MASPVNLQAFVGKPKLSLIQFSDRPDYELLMLRNEKWARLNGYKYIRKKTRALAHSHSVYFEKVRMALDAFDEGAEWVLWVDDDAMINIVNQTAEDWIARFPRADLIITREVYPLC